LVGFCRISKPILLLLALLGLAGGVCAQQAGQSGGEPIPLVDRTQITSQQVAVLKDPAGLFTFADVSKAKFTPSEERGFNFGTNGGALWFRFSVIHPSEESFALLVDNPRLEQVTFFLRMDNGTIQRMESGDGVPLVKRPFHFREIAFPLKITKSHSGEVYLRVQTSSPISLPLRLMTLETLHRESRFAEVFLSGLLGAMALLSLAALLAFAWRPSPLLGAVATMALVQSFYSSVQDGLASEYFWPTRPDMIIRGKYLLIAFLAPVALNYCHKAMDVPKHFPRINVLFWGLIVSGPVISLSSLVIPGFWVYRMASVQSGAVAGLLLILIPWAWMRGNPAGRVLFWSGFPLIAAALIVVSHAFTLPLHPAVVMHFYKMAYLVFMFTQLAWAFGQSNKTKHPTLLTHTEDPNRFIPEAQGKTNLMYTLGQFHVVRKGKPVRFTSRGVSQIQIMLAMIAAGGAAGISRRDLVDQLWPEDEGDTSETSLRTALYRLRQLIGKEALTISDQRYMLSSDVVWEDSQHFEAAARAVLSGSGSGPDPLAALNLYGGDFLPGFQAPAIVYRRETLRGLFQRLVLHAADQLAAQGDYPAALAVVEQALARSQPNERLSEKIIQLKEKRAAQTPIH